MQGKSAKLTSLDGELFAVFESLEQQPDALAVIRAAAFVDDALRFLLEHHFVDPKTAKDLLDRPLNGLAARTKLAYALRLISAEDLKDVEKLRDIRNKCAHTFRDVDLSDETFSDKTRELSAWKFWMRIRNCRSEQARRQSRKSVLLLTAAAIARDIVSPIGATRNMTKEETRKFMVHLFHHGADECDGDSEQPGK